MKIISIFKSAHTFFGNLITRFKSISKDSSFIHPGNTKPEILKESKDIAKARKKVKESLYGYVESVYSQIFTGDVVAIKEQGDDIIITPEMFETLIEKYYVTIYPAFECFISEKKMASSMAKYATICLSGLLIESLNEKKNN